jgi:hypothetical protein
LKPQVRPGVKRWLRLLGTAGNGCIGCVKSADPGSRALTPDPSSPPPARSDAVLLRLGRPGAVRRKAAFAAEERADALLARRMGPECTPDQVNSLAVKRHGAASHDTSSIGRAALGWWPSSCTRTARSWSSGSRPDLVVLHDPAGDRAAASPGGVRVGHPKRSGRTARHPQLWSQSLVGPSPMPAGAPLPAPGWVDGTRTRRERLSVAAPGHQSRRTDRPGQQERSRPPVQRGGRQHQIAACRSPPALQRAPARARTGGRGATHHQAIGARSASSTELLDAAVAGQPAGRC